MMPRRTLLTTALLAATTAADAQDSPVQQSLAEVERRHGGRLGVAVLDTATMRRTAHRGDERFALCSTCKCLTAAFVLHRVDRHLDSLDRRIAYHREDLVAYSPVTQKHTNDGGLTVGEICHAALTVSDNTAENLLFDSFGGPSALTAYIRSLGDGTTRLDRREPALNDVAPGDPRDTTTPLAIVETLHKIVLGTALSAASRQQLTAWLVACKTGDDRLRAGVPKGWRVGDKTGTGDAETNDVAILWPPRRLPIVVAAYYDSASGSEAERNSVLAEVGRLVAAL